MIIHLGYVAISIKLHDASPNRTLTYKNYCKLDDDEVKLYKLQSLTKENLLNTKRILIHNHVNDIRLYRFTSKLVPLATHPDVINWDYGKIFKKEFEDIGNYVKEKNIRVSAHPDHFTLLNSHRDDVLLSSTRDLDYHVNIFEAMGLTEKAAKLVLHVGSAQGGKERAIDRFKKNFITLPDRIRNRIILENDDKIYNIKDVLGISRELNIPMVLDIHHHWCNNEGESLSGYLKEIFETWNGEILKPKIHLSSPKCDKLIRAHGDFIDGNFFYDFLKSAKKVDRDFDVMIEAKYKDEALFKLMEDLKNFREIKILDGASFEL